MAGPSGMLGALFARLSKYGTDTLTVVTKARDDISNANYGFKELLRDTAQLTEDTVNLWMPLPGSSTVPAAVIIVKNDQNQANLQTPLLVVPPDQGDPVSTDLLSGANTIAANQVAPSWDNGKRGLLAIALINLQQNGAPALGYYTGAIFVGTEMVATLHVRVIAP